MSLPTLGALLVAILTFVIGWSVVLRDHRHRPYVTFTVLSFNLACWYLARFFTATLHSDLAFRLGLFVAAAIPLNTERFFRSFLAADPRYPPPPARAVLGGTLLLYALLVVDLFSPLHRSMLFLAPVFAFIFASLYHCVWLIWARQQTMPPRPERTRLTYLLVGGAAAVTFAGLDFLPLMGVAFPPIGSVLTVLYLYFISQTLFHYRLLDIKELLAKVVTLTALVLILSVIYGLLLAWVGPDRPGVFLFNTIVASFVILVIFEPMRGLLEDRVNRWLFAEKYEFSRRLRQLIRELANVIDVRTLVFNVLTELEHSGRVTHGSIYLASPAGTTFRLADHLGPAPPAELDARTRRLFFERLREAGLFTVEGQERTLGQQLADGKEDATTVTRNILDTMEQLHADVCLPLLADGQVLGMLALRDDRMREAYASDELELLREVAAQAAITLHNSQVYQQMKERDRLAALGQMAAGLAHEIRNPLGAIKGAAQLLRGAVPPPPAEAPHPETGASGDDAAANTDAGADEPELIDIIVQEVNRLDHVVAQFLGYARPDRGDRQLLHINQVLQRSAQLLRSQHQDAALETQLAPDLPQVRVDADQLHQVFLNLAINGLEAMGGQGQLQLETRARHAFRGGRSTQLVEISFSDSGRGIPSEHLDSIFIPFFTTRERGTGLGLPICQRIVESHGGTIEVQSTPGQGSTFTVVLPTADEGDGTGRQLSPSTRTLRLRPTATPAGAAAPAPAPTPAPTTTPTPTPEPTPTTTPTPSDGA
ncbi:MAG: GAF domain-containing protein [Proteobacteria bacterium]|nr:GAF domain-containing protein [Pseudomonadota bacterium]